MRKVIQSLLCVVCSLAVAAEARAALYGATAAGAAGTLYELNPANGAVVNTVGPLNDVIGTNYPITGMAMNPITGVIYGSTGNAPSTTAALLVTINPSTALVTVIGTYNAGPTSSGGTPATMGDLAFDSAGNLYGVGTIGGPNLYSINTTTAQATLVGPNGASTSTSGGGLAISLGGTFYGTPTSTRFGTYNSSTGAYTDIANPVKPGGGAYNALAYDASGLLYGLNGATGSPPPSYLVTIDPTTGAVTNLGQSPANSLDAIVFTPEPTSLALLVPGVLMMARRRRLR